MANLNKTAAQINLIIGAIAVEEGAGSPNITMGFSGNSIDSGVNSRANLILGGGYTGLVNKIDGSETRYATIAGGYDNHIDGVNSTDTLDAASSTIIGGAHNTIQSTHATIAGGSNNTVGLASEYGTIGGGTENTVTGDKSTVVGGKQNSLTGSYGTIGGGLTNSINGGYDTVGGGLQNAITGTYCTIGGGYVNVISASAQYSTIIGGDANTISANYGVAGGHNCDVSGQGGVALGYNNTVSNLYGVALGIGHTVSGERSFALNFTNQVSGDYAGAFGREINVSGNYSFGMALSDQNGALVSQSNTFAILGGRVGIDVAAPSAKMHLPAGTATAGTAPLKLNAGTNLTTPENGAFEFDGTNLYFTSGGTRKTISMS